MINTENNYHGTPFDRAVTRYDCPVIKLMMEYDGINVTSSNSDFPHNLTMVVKMRENIKLLNLKN